MQARVTKCLHNLPKKGSAPLQTSIHRTAPSLLRAHHVSTLVIQTADLQRSAEKNNRVKHQLYWTLMDM